MKKIMKYVIYTVATVLSLLFVYVLFNWKHVAAFPSIISAFYAKEFCSCYYVTGRDEEFCHNYSRQYVPISSFSHDQEKKTITVSGLGVTTSVSYKGKMVGCAYDQKFE